jgi:uroporphyrin-III C-methyltransferase/precorrin-2 dehydrogenase/sirohydrochlorin ferrochelatase
MAIQDIYPTALRLLGRPVLVVGGGPVAERRAKGLLDAGAKVTVVAPVATEALRGLSVPASSRGSSASTERQTSTASGSFRPPRALPPWTPR